MSADHFVTIDLERTFPGDRPRMVCKAPADATCHAVYTCSCEEWFKFGVENGAPWHVPGDYYEPERERHVGVFDPTVCNWVDWAENSDECLRGEVTFAVKPEWMGDYAVFHSVSECDDTAKLFEVES